MAVEIDGRGGRQTRRSERSIGYDQLRDAVGREIRHHLEQARRTRSVKLLLMRHAAADAALRIFVALKPTTARANSDFEHFADLVTDIRLLMSARAAIVALNEAKSGRHKPYK